MNTDLPTSILYRCGQFNLLALREGSVIFEPSHSTEARRLNSANGTQFYTCTYRCSEENWRQGLPFGG